MNEMAWLDSLTEQQVHLADMIIHKAKKEGVDPKLALALAFRESSLKHGSFEKGKDDKLVFKPTTGKSGEIGVMQIMPDTAKTFGYKPEDLNNLEKNMEIGIRILKSHLGKFNDPILAAAAYNAGPNHPYFQDPEKSLPDSTKQYLKDIAAYGGFAAPAPEGEAGETGEPGDGAQPLTLSEDIGGESAPGGTGFKDVLKQQLPGAIGAGAGATAGTVLATGQKAKRGMDMIAEFMRNQAAQAQMGATGAPSSGAPASGLPPAQGPLSNTPAGGRMTQNWIKAQDEMGNYADVGQKARSMGEAHQMKEAAIQAENKIRQIAPEMQQNPQRAGLFLPTQVGSGPRGAPTVPINTPPSLLDDAVAKLGQIARGALSFVNAPPVAGALGGYSAATSGVEAFERSQKGDKPGAAAAGVGTLGVLSAIPHPVPRAVGFAASAISPLTLMMMDKYRKIKAEPAPPPASPEEMYQARQPAFTAQRP
jgi:hypothetical protein